MKSYEEKLRELQAEHEIEMRMHKAALEMKAATGFDFRPVERGPFFTCKLQNLEEIREVVDKIPAVNENFTLNHREKITVGCPYRVTTKARVRECSLNIHYQSKYGKLWLSCPLDNWDDMPGMEEYSREVNDTEYHYYPGMRRGEMPLVRGAKLGANFKPVAWYGGQFDATDADEIMKFLKRK